MLDTEVSPESELVRRTAELAPFLESHVNWEQENRRLHDETIEALADAGVFKMRVPVRYGGYASAASTVLEVISGVGQVNGSAAWDSAVWSTCAWIASLFPDHVQDEVFADADTRVCGVLSPTGMAVPATGGLVVDGRWNFISGALHSKWQVIMAMAPTPDGAQQWPVMALVPVSDLRIVDDWYTSGLRGTGSVTTAAEGLFVPEDRVLPVPFILQGQYASKLNADSPVFRAPLMVTGCTCFTGTAIGLAKAAASAFMSRLDRKITYTDYTAQGEAAVTHFQVAEAMLKIEEAESHAARLAAMADVRKSPDDAWTLEERIRSRAYLGRVFQLAKGAVDIFKGASGASSIYTASPIQRISQDIDALNMHALMHPTTNFELFGRVLCGQAPNSSYI